MSEPIRPSTVLPATRTPFTVTTEDGQTLIAEVSAPLDNPTAAIPVSYTHLTLPTNREV